MLSDDIYSFWIDSVKIRSQLLTSQGLESLEIGLRACLREVILTRLIKVKRPVHRGWHHSLSWDLGVYEKEEVLRAGLHCHLLLDDGCRVSTCLKHLLLSCPVLSWWAAPWNYEQKKLLVP